MGDRAIEEVLLRHETCYAYNDSFNFYYKISMPRHECEAFVARRNECKGGHWIVRRKIEYENHFNLMIDKKCAGDGSELIDSSDT
jgi:hypothetical protein